MKRLALVALVLLALLGGLAAVLVRTSTGIQDALVRNVVARAARAPRTELLAPDALRVIFCGTGAPIPSRERGQACLGLFAGGRFFLVDSGTGSVDRLSWSHVPLGRLEGILLTHFHSDHIAGIPDVALGSWVAGRAKPLTLYGGPGVEQVARGFETAFALDGRYRRAHHGPALLPEEGARLEPVIVDVPAGAEDALVLEDGGLRIRAFRVEHAPVEPAYGYRVDYQGRSVVFSGDTTASERLVRVGAGADVIVHEALSPDLIEVIAQALDGVGDARRARILRDTPSYHTSPVDAARVATRAGARLLVLSHLVPPVPPGVPERVFLRGVAEARPGETIVAQDGLLLELPVGSMEIRRRMLE